MCADTAGVIVPPPLIPAAAWVLGLLLDWLLPLGLIGGLLTFWPRVVVGGLLVLAGVGFVVAAGDRFHAIGTPAPPWKPTSALATTGIFRFMRNRMYIGFLIAGIGLAVACASDWTIVLLVPAALALHYGVVLREEHYLEGKFGDEYRAYTERVRRYGLV